MSYKLGKQTVLSLNNSTSTSSSFFGLVYFDIWSPSSTSTMGGSKYFMIFIDDYSRYTWLYLMKNRSELFSIYQTFANMI